RTKSGATWESPLRSWSAIQWRDIVPGAQTERRGGAGPVGGLLGGKGPTGRFSERARELDARGGCIHLGDQPRDRPVQAAAVDPGKQWAQEACAESPGLDDPDQPGVLGVERLKPMVVNHRRPEERANPLPASRRIELGHAERRLHSAGQVD